MIVDYSMTDLLFYLLLYAFVGWPNMILTEK